MRKDYSHHPGERISAWLLHCWDNRADSTWKKPGNWERNWKRDSDLQSLEMASLKYEGIQYLRELAVLEVTYNELENDEVSKDPEDVLCTGSMGRKVIQSASESYSNRLAAMYCPDMDTPSVERVSSWLQNFEGNLCTSSSLWASALAVRGVPGNQSSPALVRGEGSPRCLLRGVLWFFLRYQGEDMRKWDGELTFKLEAHVCKLRGKTTIKKGPPKKAVSLVAVEIQQGNQRSPRHRRTEITSLDPGTGKEGPCVRQEEERNDRAYWTVWIRWPGTSDPQKHEALVDTGAQCTLVPSGYRGTEPIWISGVTGGCQELSVLEAEVSLTGDKWEKRSVVTVPEAPCILGIDYLRRGYFRDPKGSNSYLSTLPGLSEDPFVAGLLRVGEQQVPIATRTVHRRQYRANRGSLAAIHELIHLLESQGVISKTHSPFNSPIWPVQKSDGCPIQLELTAPGVEAQPYHLSWTNPNCTGKA
ncbi:hypothetical protein QYF61_021407 [Mycteria americana]|uniref:Peptidase A2 domain-containing protein n=1 Tax=Mycteria americana TaxID=33587 RepID=A0AAN7NND3_MYCAM|nr:hypothetical protein QYF61_021407 [Mycteria americana]